MKDNRTLGQRWADQITAWSGSWNFIGWFAAICAAWLAMNIIGIVKFDIYPFIFLNLILTITSTFQSPLILLSQNRQNETDRETVQDIVKRLSELQKSVDQINNRVI